MSMQIEEPVMFTRLSDFTPSELVTALDKYIIGQYAAKRAIAIALVNRSRRMRLDTDMRREVTPKNIIMIGQTGVGKTEIARRVAQLTDSPFLKVEATRYTEVGYVGRDVESIVRDLVERAMKLEREAATKMVRDKANVMAEEKVLDKLLPPPRKKEEEATIEAPNLDEHNHSREILREKLRGGLLDEKEIEIEVSGLPIGVEIMGPPGMEEMTNQLQSLFQNIGSERLRRRKMRVQDALKSLQEEEANRLVNEEEIRAAALEKVEQKGIIFIDEIDKVAKRGSRGDGGEVSREGVQRDLLPLVEGCSVNTKYGMVRTDHILFIAAGAFHVAKPSDLIPELQGRFPIRVELTSLSIEEFIRILSETDFALTRQYLALLSTEEVKLVFTNEGIHRLAEIAWHLNETLENIGARRLYTVMEKTLEDISFEAEKFRGKTIRIDKNYVDKRLNSLMKDQDLSHYIL